MGADSNAAGLQAPLSNRPAADGSTSSEAGAGAGAQPEGERRKHSCAARCRTCMLLTIVLSMLCAAWLGYAIWKKQWGVVHGPSNSVFYYMEDELGVTEDLEVDHVWLTIPQASETEGNAVFASTEYFFESKGRGGYVGTQVFRGGILDGRTEKHQAIFSAWDVDDEDGHHRVGWIGKTCGRFGGEGVGSHCILPFDFQEGRLYTVRVALSRFGSKGDLLTGFLMDASTGEALVIGSLILPSVQGFQGFGRLRAAHSISFQEYLKGTGCEGQAFSRVGLIGPYFSNRTIVPVDAQANYHAEFNCRRSDSSACIPGFGCGAPRVFFTGGGEVERTVGPRQHLWNTTVSPDFMV